MGLLQLRGVSVEIDYEGKSLKSQMRRSDKFGSRFTLIIGEEELAKGRAVLKEMDAGAQGEVALLPDDIAGKITRR
ncbi:MAG: histidyl-tRNA [Geobacteraceae bacterium]|nr:MAG: histidyl-tRNA [Geobacteraceae bacterium]